MKKRLLLLSLFSIALQAFAQKTNTTVTGKLEGFPAQDKIYLSTLGDGYRDSTQQTDKGFRFDLDIPDGHGNFYILQAGRNNWNNGAFIYLEKGKLHIVSKTDQLKDATYSGGKLADYYNLFKNRPQVQGQKELYEQYEVAQSKKDEKQMDTLLEAIRSKDKEQQALDRNFVLKHKNSSAIVYPMFFTLRDQENLGELDQILQQLSPQAKNNEPVKSIEHSIKTDKLTGIGRTALPFAQTDPLGKTVSLNDFKGKYVLIDFWASWCVPCRHENPNVVSAYQQYKNKNFTVLGISFDNPGQHNRWIDAIHADNLTWTHLSDLKGWKNEVGVLYDIKSIPSNLLIDPNGIIVAKNLRGELLDEKLKELLGEPTLDKNTFVLKAELENPTRLSWFHIRYTDHAGKAIADSVQIFDGVFSYIGHTQYPTQAMGYFTDSKGEAPQSFDKYIRFFIEPGVISLQGNTDSPPAIQIAGSKVQDENIQYDNLIETESQSMKPISEAYEIKNSEYMDLKKQGASEEALNAKLDELDKLKEQMEPYQKQMRDKQLAYIKKNPNSYVSISQLRYFVSGMNLEELQDIYGQISAEIKASPSGRELAEEIDKLKSGSPGSIATDFSGTDINGKQLRLADYRGQYVLLDFWASWCIPCRKGNPHLLQLYSKYKKKGFEIIGVSDDDSNHAAWRKAVEQDKIGVWKHVLRGLKRTSDGNFDRSEDKSEHYGIHTLPSKILINPEGVIIGRYASGAGSDDDLDKKLKEIFKF
ncbi:MAG: redoxin domain-containing protein [Sphingobacterium sp.]|nr:redoxin domain-containing protein [Sphingobacterium sp.]